MTDLWADRQLQHIQNRFGHFAHDTLDAVIDISLYKTINYATWQQKLLSQVPIIEFRFFNRIYEEHEEFVRLHILNTYYITLHQNFYGVVIFTMILLDAEIKSDNWYVWHLTIPTVSSHHVSQSVIMTSHLGLKNIFKHCSAKCSPISSSMTVNRHHTIAFVNTPTSCCSQTWTISNKNCSIAHWVFCFVCG